VRRINPVHAPSHCLKIHFNIIIHLRLGLPSGLLPSGLPTKILYAPFPSPIRAACPAHLIVLDLITYEYTFVNSEDWVKLKFTFFSTLALSSVYLIYICIYIRFVVLTAAFRRIQVVCVVAVSLCEWFRTFCTWVLRSFETSGTTDQTTQPIVPENLNPHFTASLHVNVS
jgi:hypothetical protein